MVHVAEIAPSPLEAVANQLRRHSLISTDAAGSGHPTSCLSCAELMAVLFFDRIRIDFDHPRDQANDHFILSKGHAAPILWATLAEAGAISDAELKSLREFDSDLEGHPTPRNRFVDVASGSLGQGLSAGLGMALADKRAGRPNRTYVLAGDGEMAEGSIWEAIAFAGHHKLDNLTLIIDVNGYGQSGATMLEHNVKAYRRRLEAFEWRAFGVEDGNAIADVQQAFDHALGIEGHPTAIVAKTTKGAGVPDIEGESGSHGKPAPDLQAALDALPDLDDPEGKATVKKPEKLLGDFPQPPQDSITLALPDKATEEPLSPRKAFGKAIAQIPEKIPQAIVLDGDVCNSTYTEPLREDDPDRFVESYIAEQNMVGMALGLSQIGYQPWVATFAAFLTRAHDQIRMAGVSRARIKFAGTHVGIATGEDGPSQMGLEDIAMFRSIPGSLVLQPCDTVSATRCAELMATHDGISYLRLFRPDADPIYSEDTEFRIGGSNTLAQSEQDQVTVIASGVTVHYALNAAKQLARKGEIVRLIDCYSIKPIDRETLRAAARQTRRVVIVDDHYEDGGLADAAHAAMAGIDYEHRTLCVRDLPRSGSQDRLAAEFGLDSAAISEAVSSLL